MCGYAALSVNLYESCGQCVWDGEKVASTCIKAVTELTVLGKPGDLSA